MNIFCISLAICKLIGFLQWRAIFRPSWLGYWHVLNGRQYFPRLWRCFGQMVIWSWLILSSGGSNIPALANINAYSVTFARDKWQLLKWFEMSLLHSLSKTTCSFPLDSPHSILPSPKKEHLVALVVLAILLFTSNYIRVEIRLSIFCQFSGQRHWLILDVSGDSFTRKFLLKISIFRQFWFENYFKRPLWYVADQKLESWRDVEVIMLLLALKLVRNVTMTTWPNPPSSTCFAPCQQSKE